MGTLHKAKEFINRHQSFILTTHEGPDADGIGAELVLARVLAALQKKVRVINADPVPERFAFLDALRTIEAWKTAPLVDPPGDTGMIVLDTSDELNLGVIGTELLPRCREVMIIDHHEPSPLTHLGGFVDTDAASTCEMIVQIAGVFGVAIDRDMASIAYAGILYDTGSFIYPKTSARTFKAALDLVKAGAVPNKIYQNLFESASVGALLLQKQVLSSLDLRASNRIALQTLTKQDLKNSGAAYEDAESLINIPLKSKEIEVSILVKENEDGRIRCSLRSKGRVNVSAIAQTFGGGGHRTAAGFKSRQGLAETKEEVLKKVISALEME